MKLDHAEDRLYLTPREGKMFREVASLCTWLAKGRCHNDVVRLESLAGQVNTVVDDFYRGRAETKPKRKPKCKQAFSKCTCDDSDDETETIDQEEDDVDRPCQRDD